MASQYRPISCDLYDHFEIAAMRHLKKHLTYRSESGAVITEELECLDLNSHDGEEFLLVINIRGQHKKFVWIEY